jgi:hypothetical protein
MDVFKLAFETTVVGLLTVGWLTVVTCLLFPNFRLDSLVQALPELLQRNLTAVGIGALILAYCLGSAVLPISSQLVNDEHWPINESAIRCQVFTRQQLYFQNLGWNAIPQDKPPGRDKPFTLDDLQPYHCSYWAPIFTPEKIGFLERLNRFGRRWIGLPINSTEEKAVESPQDLEKTCRSHARSSACDEFKALQILTIFQQQETAVLNQPSDRTEGLRQLHERIVVLRGSIFSGFVLLLVCLFAYFARANGDSSHWIRPLCGGVLALAFTVFAGFNGYQDLVDRNIFDVPVLESLMMVITILGITLAVRRAKSRRFHSKRYVLITLFFTGLAYGGWMWSEVIYDQQVISSYVVLQQNPPAPK